MGDYLKKLLLFIGIIISMLTACSNDTSQSQKIILTYPESVQETIMELPEDFRNKIIVPSKLPDIYSVIDFGYTSEPINDPNGNIILTDFIYAGKNSQLVLTTMYGNVSFANEYGGGTITLDNGIEAKAGDFSLRWENKNGDFHELSLMVPPDTTEIEMTMDDLIEIANSME